MVGVADQQSALQFVGFQNHGHAPGGLLGVVGLGLGDQVHVRDAELREVVAADLAFAELRVLARSRRW